MAILRMEVELVQATQSKMVSERDNIQQHIDSLTGQINQMVGSTWIGTAATEFLQNYDNLRMHLSQQLQTLGQLAAVLNTEISQWQDMAARLG